MNEEGTSRGSTKNGRLISDVDSGTSQTKKKKKESTDVEEKPKEESTLAVEESGNRAVKEEEYQVPSNQGIVNAPYPPPPPHSPYQYPGYFPHGLQGPPNNHGFGSSPNHPPPRPPPPPHPLYYYPHPPAAMDPSSSTSLSLVQPYPQYSPDPYYHPFYEAQMQSRAVAYANAAAGAAWAAAQAASQAAANCTAAASRNKREHDDRRAPNRRRRARWNSSDSSSSGGQSWRPVKRKTTSLLGKSGVAALFQWSGKRHITPTLTLQHRRAEDCFECIVYLPACKFDEEVLQEWGRGRGRSKGAAKQEAARIAVSALMPGVEFDKESGVVNVLPNNTWTPYSTDELPQLAQRLTIDHRSVNDEETTKRARETTTSEEDSESAYFAREGASVCSHLLHSMMQINPERLPNAPVFIYETPSNGIPFKCTGHMRTRDEDLVATGVGGTKREARHVASAQLLAQLFPQCGQNMAAVKEAAEKIKEEYTKDRVAKQQLRKTAERAIRGTARKTTDWATREKKKAIGDASKTPAPDQSTLITNEKVDNTADSPSEQDKQDEDDLVSSVNAVDLGESCPSEVSPKRCKYADEFAAAFSRLNNQAAADEYHQDVGRTILRRAEPIDLPHILQLFYEDANPSTLVVARRTEEEGGVQPDANSTPVMVVIILCRAIAAYEDPPLGCALVARESDDLLRLVQMATQHHLPEERFLECLENFACCMKCTLEPKITDTVIPIPELMQLMKNRESSGFERKGQLQSVLEGSEEDSEESRPKKRGDLSSKRTKRSRVV